MANQLTWLGHSGCQLTTSKGKVLLIDPWLNGNPAATLKVEDLPKADYVLLTHDHSDHAGDTVAVVQHTGATLVAQPETCKRYQEAGVPNDRILYGIGMNIGGTVDLDGIQVTMTDAYHSSETGEPAGYIITLEDGKVVYHAGDTGLHANMATWGNLFDIDVALLPIGSVFTMDGRQAARALTMLKPRIAVPIHYATFPILAPNPDEFVREAKAQAPSTEVRVLRPGESLSF